MKDLAVDESLSEEARDSARKALEVLVSSQLLDIEQAAAIKKLESEALLVDQQDRIENQKLEAKALAEAKKVEVESLAEIKKLEAEAQLKRQRSEAKKMLVSDDMVEWLQQHRLQECAADLARIAGAYAHEREAC